MKKLLLISIVALLFGPLSRAQENSPIVLKKRVYYQNDKRLTNKDMKSILLSKPESAAEYKIAKTKSNIGAVPMIAGTGLCLYSAVVMLKQSADDANSTSQSSDQSKFVTPALIGAGLVFVGIPFLLSANKHMMKSIDLYNKSSKTGYIPNLNIGITPNGVGIVCRF
jgi:hypothetical protein